MSYLHIENLYKNQAILMFRECYALEKIHGTSAHIGWKDGSVRFFAGGAKQEHFEALFTPALHDAFAAIGHPELTVYGEAYGGKMQGMRETYGPALRFVAFEVRVGDTWLAVPAAEDVAGKLGQEFVYYRRIATDLAAIDAERDAPSEQARRNGIEGDKFREGIVLRPLVEVRLSNGDRVIAKHKRDEFKETKTPRAVDPAEAQVLADAQAIAEEWVTPMRLAHVLDKMPGAGIERTRDVIAAMTEDVRREAAGEIVESKAAMRAIGQQAAMLFKKHLQAALARPEPAHE